MKRLAKFLFMHERERCELCDGSQSLGSSLPLCHACLQKIPWIRSIACHICGRPDPCPDCNVRETRYLKLQRSAVRYNTEMKQWLQRYKYAGEAQLAHLFARMMAPAFSELLEADDLEALRSERTQTVLTFVPSGKERLTDRGFNQSARLALTLSKASGIPVFPLLRKVQAAAHQSHKGKVERMRAVRGMYALHVQAVEKLAAELQYPSRIMIIDDVYTTGSTLHECGRLLQTGLPCTVLGLTWARS